MKRVSTSKILIAAAVLLVLTAIGVFFFARFTDHADIRNLSGQTDTDVVLQCATTRPSPRELPV